MSRLILILLLLAACDKQVDVVSKGTKKISEVVHEYAPDTNKSVEELEKLHQVEYEVFVMPLNSSNSKQKETLNEMGKKRWDCFHVEKINLDSQNSLLFYCKRTPDTILRYVPRTLIGR